MRKKRRTTKEHVRKLVEMMQKEEVEKEEADKKTRERDGLTRERDKGKRPNKRS